MMCKVKKVLTASVSLLLVLTSVSVSSGAGGEPKDPEMAELNQKIENLTRLVEQYQEKTEKLEARLVEQEANQKLLTGKVKMFANVPEKIVQIPPMPVPEKGVVETAQMIGLSGFVDTSYNYNFRHPGFRSAGNTTLRAFDRDENNFNLNMVELVMERLAKETGGVGFRVDLDCGEDARIITPTPDSVDESAIQQAYVNVRVPIGNGLEAKAGRFVTMAGVEVIESKDNWNASRSFLFQNAIPYTHTGVRFIYPVIKDKLTVHAGLNNGWDQAIDNNNFKTIEAMMIFTPTDRLNLSSVILYGPEQGSPTTHGKNGDKRGLLSNVATFKVTPKLSLMSEYDFGWEPDAVGRTNGGVAEWQGVATYVRYVVNEKLAFAARAEFFADSNGARTGANQQLSEYTLTADYKIWGDLLTRLEYRQDFSNKNAYIVDTDTGLGTDHTQQTIMAELIYTF